MSQLCSLLSPSGVQVDGGRADARSWLAQRQAGNGPAFLIAPNRMSACKLLTWDAGSAQSSWRQSREIEGDTERWRLQATYCTAYTETETYCQSLKKVFTVQLAQIFFLERGTDRVCICLN